MNSLSHGESRHMALVVGVDGSGKSAFLANVEDRYGAEIVEPTSSPEIKAFKSKIEGQPITPALIAEREDLFLEHNTNFVECLTRSESSFIATTGNSLVTLISHGLMRSIVSGYSAESVVSDSIDRWRETKQQVPDELILLKAPFHVILQRIRERQNQGQREEAFWGFNSPHFLTHYQSLWDRLTTAGTESLGMPALSLDSDQLSPNEMISVYSRFHAELSEETN